MTSWQGYNKGEERCHRPKKPPYSPCLPPAAAEMRDWASFTFFIASSISRREASWDLLSGLTMQFLAWLTLPTHTVYSVIYTTQCNTNNKYNTQCNTHSQQHNLHNTVQHKQQIQYTVQHTQSTVWFMQHSATHVVYSVIYTTQYDTNNKHDTQCNTHSLQCDLHNAQCNSHSLQCDLNNTVQHKQQTQHKMQSKQQTQYTVQHKQQTQCTVQHTQSTVWFAQHTMPHRAQNTQCNTCSLQCNWKHIFCRMNTGDRHRVFHTAADLSPNQEPVQKGHLNISVYNQRKKIQW